MASISATVGSAAPAKPDHGPPPSYEELCEQLPRNGM